MKRKNNKSTLGALVLGASLALAGCGNEIESGEVYEKQYEPEKRWVQMMPMVLSTGKMSTVVMVPITHYDDEDFIIKIKKYNSEKGEFDKGKFYVDKETYSRYELGDYFDANKTNAETEDKIVKIKHE
jgi:hypothetical protein